MGKTKKADSSNLPGVTSPAQISATPLFFIFSKISLLTNTSLALRSPKLPLLKWQQSPHPHSLCKPHRRIAPLRAKRLGDKWKE
jgi:hypothetical protein